MKGARALASGMLALGVACAVPAVSDAQDPGAAATTTTTATSPEPMPPPPTAPAPSPNPGEAVSPAPSADPPAAAAPSPVTVRSSKGAALASSTSVTMGDFFFSAATITISAGDTVTWHNTGQAPHTATANDGSFDTGTVNPGGSASHTFDSAGTFSYICTIHPNMKGTVRVLSSSSGSGSNGGGSGGSGGSAGASSSGSAPSEEQAVASPNAAGNSSTLPMTGMAAGALALVGLGLLGSGLALRRVRRGELSGS